MSGYESLCVFICFYVDLFSSHCLMASISSEYSSHLCFTSKMHYMILVNIVHEGMRVHMSPLLLILCLLCVSLGCLVTSICVFMYL